MKQNGVEVQKDVLRDTTKAIQALTRKQVLVGIPGDDKVNNAMLGYVHEFGLPAKGIPQRAHLVPGVRRIEAKIVKAMKVAGQVAMTAGARGLNAQQRDRLIDQTLTKVGILAVNSVKEFIRAGIPPGLKRATLMARARRKVGGGVGIRKGALAEIAYREKAKAAGVDIGLSITSTTPLIDTGAYWNAITFVLDVKNASAKGVSMSAEKAGVATDQTIVGPKAEGAPVVGEQPEAP